MLREMRHYIKVRCRLTAERKTAFMWRREEDGARPLNSTRSVFGPYLIPHDSVERKTSFIPSVGNINSF